MNEKELILSLQRKHPKAFQLLVDNWQHMVFNTILGIVQNIEEAEDLSQEVFIQIYESIDGFRAEAKLSTWIYRIALSKALDAERKKKAKKRFSGIKTVFGYNAEVEPVHFEHPGIIAENKERARFLFKALQLLPDNQRAAFVLIKTEGLNYEETALIMKISIKAVEALMHRAKGNLRKILQTYHDQ